MSSTLGLQPCATMLPLFVWSRWFSALLQRVLACRPSPSPLGFECAHPSLTLSKPLQNLKIQMKDFEVSAEPVQNWLSKTERLVQESSNRLYDLPAKRREQQKLQVMGPAI